MDTAPSSASGLTLGGLVDVFYRRVWNARDDDALIAILAPDVRFRGSTESVDRIWPEAFKVYRNSIHNCLHDYSCTIQDIVTDGSVAFARVSFSGYHSGGLLLGVPPTNRHVHWIGAARFAFAQSLQPSGVPQIGDIWVLSDLHGLQKQLLVSDERVRDAGVALEHAAPESQEGISDVSSKVLRAL